MAFFQKKKALFTIAVILLLGVFGFLALPKNNKKDEKRVCFRNYCFKVELARTDAEQRRGLMFRKTLGKDQGMLFIFEKEGIYPFWMKNTFLPLDIIWIDKDFRVVYLSQNTAPCEERLPCLSINPQRKAQYVLEIKGGMVERMGLGVGQKMAFYGVF